MNASVESRQIAVEHAAVAVRTGAELIEDRFLAVGSALDEALAIVGSLTGRVAAIPAEINSESMMQASETLWRIASEMSAVCDALPVERAALDGVKASLDRMHAPLDRLVTSIRTLAILARSSRIEAAYLSNNRYNFVEFADEIVQLAAGAQGGVNAHARSYAAISRQVAEARDSQRRFEAERGQDLRNSVLELQAAFDAIETRQHDAVRVSARVAENSARIGDVVGDVIMSLQAGDSTRQRLEHIERGLSAPAEDEAELAATCALQGAQLAHALVDFDSAVTTTRASLASIGSDADAIVALGRSLINSDSAETLHERLSAKLSAVRALILECETARLGVDSVMRTLSGALAEFRDRMETLNAISFSITTVGMNAAIKSARLGGEGRALAVISQDLRHYAGQIVGDTRELMDVFQAVLDCSMQLESARSRQDSSRLGQAETDIAAMMETLGRNEATLMAALRLFADGGSRLEQVLGEADHAFAALEDDMAPVQHAAATLAVQGRGARPVAVAASGRYTMESERRIHQSLRAVGA
ncbi:hypothetical protein [Alsobacter metallidurans]|uniref:hypothetical protein n=1 Tax=Alsobacter metallidurans TaxID=340221 RepID=UPI00188CD925|nr:hypothetical protein [Alsobacter metallidurans]